MINVKTQSGIRSFDPDKLDPRRPQPNRGVNRVIPQKYSRDQLVSHGYQPLGNHLRKQFSDGTICIVLMGNLKP